MTANPLITTPFTAQSTAAEVVHGIDLTGQRVIVTGGASGIGIETARALAGAGAEVTLAVRNRAAGERTARDITASWSRRWTSPTRYRSRPSARPGPGRCTYSSTTRA
jgi:NAD(P)-dependent dehydrogenase (short-subunit alcohol dehydrogenase family)